MIRLIRRLIEDLFARGMLDDTMVCNLAEFGRTPKVNPAGGRDHWPQCFTVYFAGGGVKGGQAIGASDPIGAVPVDRPTEPPDVVATIMYALGLNHEGVLPGPNGRPFPLVDSGFKPIYELFADPLVSDAVASPPIAHLSNPMFHFRLLTTIAIIFNMILVVHAEEVTPVEFTNHVQAILSKAGCNMGACHGALAGKGGFRLSLSGYDAQSDHFTTTQEDRSRRIDLNYPERSLLLLKPTGKVRTKAV